MLPAIHGGPAEDSSLCSYFLLIHVSQCILLFHCSFPILILSFDSFNFKFGTCPENSSTGKTVSESLQSLLHNSFFFFCLHALHSLEGFTEDTVKEQSVGIWQSFLRKNLLQIPCYIPANLCLLFPCPCCKSVVC